jgi:predicted small lipoprotein YifL
MKNGKDLWTPERFLTALGILLLLLTGCGPSGPVLLQPGDKECEHCHMMIHDVRFHTQISNSKGKIRHFDSVECALAFKKKNPRDVAALYVTDFLHPGSFLSLTGHGEPAVLVQSSKIKSPMGGGIAAVRSAEVGTMVDKFGAVVRTAQELEAEERSAVP